MAYDPGPWFPVAAFVGGAAIFFVGGMQTTELACERANNRCQLTTQSLFGDGAASFAVDDVREVRFVTGLGKNGHQAESVLIFRAGNELRLARGDTDDVQPQFRAFQTYFAPNGPPSLDWQDGRSPLALALSVACAAAAVWFGREAVRRLRRRDQTPEPVVAGGGGSAGFRRYALMAGGLIALSGAITGVMYFVELRSKGRLDLVCNTRCRFQGTECAPGANISMSLEPGSHTIEVWTASGDALWTPKQFEVRVGETTHYVCQQ